jgi:hypothetical protein
MSEQIFLHRRAACAALVILPVWEDLSLVSIFVSIWLRKVQLLKRGAYFAVGGRLKLS